MELKLACSTSLWSVANLQHRNSPYVAQGWGQGVFGQRIFLARLVSFATGMLLFVDVGSHFTTIYHKIIAAEQEKQQKGNKEKFASRGGQLLWYCGWWWSGILHLQKAISCKRTKFTLLEECLLVLTFASIPRLVQSCPGVACLKTNKALNHTRQLLRFINRLRFCNDPIFSQQEYEIRPAIWTTIECLRIQILSGMLILSIELTWHLCWSIPHFVCCSFFRSLGIFCLYNWCSNQGSMLIISNRFFILLF